MGQLENFRLKVFRAVAEHLNFHDAAEHLFLTQPAVTLQIKALENDLGVRLFDRARGGITLTREGSVLLSYANKVAKLVAEAERGRVLEVLRVFRLLDVIPSFEAETNALASFQPRTCSTTR